MNQATQSGIVVVITRPNTTNIDLREASEVDSTATFGANFTNTIKKFQVLRFSSWAIGREADANSFGLYNDSEWETRCNIFRSEAKINTQIEQMTLYDAI